MIEVLNITLNKGAWICFVVINVYDRSFEYYIKQRCLDLFCSDKCI